MKKDKTPTVLQMAFASAWPQPASRDFAELSDPILFSEVLEFTHKEGSVSLQKLTSETEGLRKRLRRLWVIDKPTRTTINGLLSAMKKFGWLKENGISRPFGCILCVLPLVPWINHLSPTCREGLFS